ncbi:MAG TPA: kelch repeat-containing protein [Pyrinomonadaceae bacterium]|nr:kelch repeat-containing protein [Pyrinomonadaceae bacterium]
MHFKISEINHDRWQELNQLFEAVIELEPRQRPDFIDTACSGDPVLREEIEALLRSDADGWSFLEEPALQLAAPFVSDEQPQLAPGDQLGDYTIENLIGRGGMGEVYLAKDRVLNRRIALKVLPVEYTRDRDRLLRFQNEAQAASALNHPNILTIYQLGNIDGLQFIVTEFVEGVTIRELLTRQTLDLKQVLDVAIQISSALAAAHKAGIVHRDIKPENIMLRPDGYVKVLDFGLAKLSEPAAAEGGDGLDPAVASHANISSALLMGTVRYMSPEQARGVRVDARSDVFSLGVMLYEMIAGRVPFEDDDITRLIESILHKQPASLDRVSEAPAELVAVANKALSKDREERYQSVDDLLTDLRALKSVQEKTPASAVKRFAGAVAHHKGVAAITLVLITLASISGYVWYKRHARAAANLSSNASKYLFTGKWTNKGSISVPRRDVALVVIDGALYAAGGWETCTPYANLEAYDSANDRWTNRAPMLTARGGHGAGTLNGNLYVVGGRTDCDRTTTSVEVYDPRTNQWSDRAPLPSAREGPVVAAVNGRLYAIGGSDHGQSVAFNTEYDPAADRWIERAPLPTPREYAAAVVVNNLIYVIGGGRGPAEMRSLVVYDPVSDRWSAKAPMPVGRLQFGAAVLNDRIYVFGGVGNNGQVDAYDPATDSWSTGPSMPSMRTGLGATSFNGSIYFAGGQDESHHLSSVMTFTPCSDRGAWITKAPMPTSRSSSAIAEIHGTIYIAGGYTAPWIFHTVTEAYDPANNTWSTKAPMPTARDITGTNGAVVNGKMYVMGGNAKSKGAGFGFCTDANEAYDPVTDTWSTRAPMPTARCHIAAVALNGLIYAVGGANTSGSIRYSTVEIYNPVTNSWTKGTPMPTERDQATAVVIDGILYVAGGMKLSGALNTVEAFDPKTNRWTTKAPMPTPRFQHAAVVIDGSLFVVGGVNGLAFVPAVDVFDPATNSWTTLLLPLPTARKQTAVVQINNSLFAIGGADKLDSPSFVGTNEQFISPSCLGEAAGVTSH